MFNIKATGFRNCQSIAGRRANVLQIALLVTCGVMENLLHCLHYGPVWNDQTTNQWSKK